MLRCVPVDGSHEFIEYAISQNASDIHINVGVPITIRVAGKLYSVNDDPVTVEKANELISCLVPEGVLETLMNKKDVDFSFGYKDMRFRANIFFEKGNMSASIRIIPDRIRGFKELGLSPVLKKFTQTSQGFVIVVGPTGCGKSTTLAALIEKINNERRSHIVTIEDPIEYVFQHKKSIISQREIGQDTKDFARALRSALREDPDVVLVGEMRDLETIHATLAMAETGHLVFTTLHTNSAAQTTDRIVNMFPIHQQQQIRSQLASVILGVVSQRLIPCVDGGLVLAAEIMIANSAIRSLIREGKDHQIPNVIQTSASEGMVLLDKVLAELVSQGKITMEDALTWSLDLKTLKMMIHK